jgi:hypothetical protein
MLDNKRTPWLARSFWIAACANLLLVLSPALAEWNQPQGEFSGLVVFALLMIALGLAVVIAIVAALRRPMAYGVGLAVVCAPAAWFALNGAAAGVASLSAPSIADQDSGRGYFTAPADRALAEAIVAGDAAKVAQLAPAANLNAQGWSEMTFMRLALDHDSPSHAVLAALLQAGIDPDQASSALYSQIYNEKDEALLRLVVGTGVDLNKHMGKGHWYLFIPYDWPAGLALMLDYGADPEVQDGMGYTLIMRAAQAESWPTVETLLARGARTDHAGNDGRTLRDLLSAASARHAGEIPPPIAALQETLR